MKTSFLSNLFCKLTNIRILPVLRKRGTFKISYINFKTYEARALYIQFSLKDPWLLPHYEKHYGKVDIPLAGWLFFYFGVLTEGLVYGGDEDAKLIDKNGNKYYYVPFDTRAEADDYHEKIKNGKKFYISKNDFKSKIVVREL